MNSLNGIRLARRQGPVEFAEHCHLARQATLHLAASLASITINLRKVSEQTAAATTQAELDAALDGNELESQRASRLLNQAASSIEPEVTAKVKELVEPFGGRCWGLGNRFKSRIGLLRKIYAMEHKVLAASQQDGQQLSAKECASEVFRLHTAASPKAGDPVVVDALRYTVLLPQEGYTAAVETLRTQLHEAGYRDFDMKNFWCGKQTYRGVNDNFIADVTDKDCVDTGMKQLLFEIQWHTFESNEHRLQVQGMYEEWRDTFSNKTPIRRRS